jgi:hypothetical protein
MRRFSSAYWFLNETRRSWYSALLSWIVSAVIEYCQLNRESDPDVITEYLPSPDFTSSNSEWYIISEKSRDSSVSIAVGYGLDNRGPRVWFPAGAGNFSLHHRVQNVSGAHSASYQMGTSGSFPGGKVAGAWSWPLTSIWCRGQEWAELYLYSPNTSSWRGD